MTDQLQSSSYSTSAAYSDLRDELAAADARTRGKKRPNRSAVLNMGLVRYATAFQDAAIHELALCAAVAFGRSAALWATKSGVIVGAFEYDGRWVARDDQGAPITKANAWNFNDGPWSTVGSRGPTEWVLKLSTRPALLVSPNPYVDATHASISGVQIASGQGVAPTGHLPYIWLRTGTGDIAHTEPLPVWDWLDRSRLADADGAVFELPVDED